MIYFVLYCTRYKAAGGEGWACAFGDPGGEPGIVPQEAYEVGLIDTLTFIYDASVCGPCFSSRNLSGLLEVNISEVRIKCICPSHERARVSGLNPGYVNPELDFGTSHVIYGQSTDLSIL